jgi:hypothetical protein
MKKCCFILAVICLAGCTTASKKPFQNTTSRSVQPIINYDVSLDAQLDSLARQVALQLGTNSSRRIGLTGFFDLKGRTRRFEKYVEIEFTNRLIRTGQFKICASDELARMNKRTLSDIVGDEVDLSKNAMDVLEMLEIDSYMTGSTIDLPQSIKISVKLISSKTGSVFGTASVMVHKDSMVESLLDDFGIKRNKTSAGITGNFPAGDVIRVNENQYINLIPSGYVLYIKQINFEYDLFTEKYSNVEIFLNEEYRVMRLNDMISLTYENERYVLSLRNIIDRLAVFTFARLSSNPSETTDPFSLKNKDPYGDTEEDDGADEQTEDDVKSSDDETMIESEVLDENKSILPLPLSSPLDSIKMLKE